MKRINGIRSPGHSRTYVHQVDLHIQIVSVILVTICQHGSIKSLFTFSCSYYLIPSEGPFALDDNDVFFSVVMQPIPDNMVTMSKIDVVVAKCERALNPF